MNSWAYEQPGIKSANLKSADVHELLTVSQALGTCGNQTARGRCYDHNFLRFFLIFSEKICVFLKYQCYAQFFSKFGFVLSQKRQFFAKFFGENILKIITSVPGI
jgi:hypothetical protein